MYSGNRIALSSAVAGIMGEHHDLPVTIRHREAVRDVSQLV